MIALRMVKYGLGNQLFAYSYARYCAKKAQEEVIVFFPKTMGHGYSYENGFGQSLLPLKKVSLLQLTLHSKGRNIVHKTIMAKQVFRTGLKGVNSKLERSRDKELRKHHIFINYNIGHDSDRFRTPLKDMYIQGYYQFPYYPSYIREELLTGLILSQKKTDTYCDILQIMSEKNSVAVHIRRGDYLLNDRFLVYGESYLTKAVEHITAQVSTPYFFIFAEDSSYVDSVKHIFDGYKFMYVSELVSGDSKDYDELCLMGHCKHFIISNSTYSWWGQFLGTYPGKIVVAPSKWYQKDDMQCGLLDDSWIKI